MQHFFILTNAGVNYRRWNRVLKTNPFFISHFNEENPKYYLNKNISFIPAEYEKAHTRHFDILVFDWQTGFKDALDFSTVVYLKDDVEKCYNNIKANGIIHKKHIETYLDLREKKIKKIISRNNNHIILHENKGMYSNLQNLADFLKTPYFFNLETDH